MAYEWIKMRTNLLTDLRVNRISAKLKIQQTLVVGGLYCLWSVADTFSSDGFLPDYDCESLNFQTGIDGFAEELLRVGWLEEVDGGLRVSKFDEHNSESSKKRFQDMLRKQSSRNSGSGDSDNVTQQADKPVTNSGQCHKKNGQRHTDDGQAADLELEIELEPELKLKGSFEKDSLSSSDDGATPETVLQEFNKANGVTPARTLNKKRTQTLKSRLRDPQWAWREALAKFPLPCFSDDSWTPNFDWFIRPDTVSKILEGQYDWQKNRAGPGKPSKMEFKGLQEFLKDGEDDTS